MNFAVILCGGKGVRMGGDIPKQYLKVNEKYIFSYCLDVFEKNLSIDKFVICAHEEWRPLISKTIEDLGIKKEVIFSVPGETRQMTVYNSLKAVEPFSKTEKDLVIIHDSVRPLITEEIINNCIRGCENFEASIATTQVKDTIYQTDNGDYITNVPKRSSLRAGQTPEAFNLKLYKEIHDNCTKEYINSVTGGAEFASNNDMKVCLTEGSEYNIKITTKKDLDLFIELINNKPHTC